MTGKHASNREWKVWGSWVGASLGFAGAVEWLLTRAMTNAEVLTPHDPTVGFGWPLKWVMTSESVCEDDPTGFTVSGCAEETLRFGLLTIDVLWVWALLVAGAYLIERALKSVRASEDGVSVPIRH